MIERFIIHYSNKRFALTIRLAVAAVAVAGVAQIFRVLIFFLVNVFAAGILRTSLAGLLLIADAFVAVLLIALLSFLVTIIFCHS